jgi:cysteine desulfurase/selenocysteine lyase
MRNENGIKTQFPFFKNNNICYLDNAAATQKPYALINAISKGYELYSFPAGKSFYKEAENSFEIFLKTKKNFANLINTESYKNIFFSFSSTISSNILFEQISQILPKNAAIAIPIDGHDSFLNPWKRNALKFKFKLFFYDQNNFESFESLVFKNNINLLLVNAISHITGFIFDQKYLDNILKNIKNKPIVLVDAAQLFPIKRWSLKECNVDAIFCSAYKMYGPYGVSAIYISDFLKDLLDKLNYKKNKISNEKHLLESFSQGIINIPSIYAFNEIIEWNKEYVYKSENINKQKKLVLSLNDFFKDKTNFKIISNSDSINIFTFYSQKINSIDLAEKLAQKNICVRAGNICAETYCKINNIKSVVRISLGIYNNENDIEKIKDYFFNK